LWPYNKNKDSDPKSVCPDQDILKKIWFAADQPCSYAPALFKNAIDILKQTMPME